MDIFQIQKIRAKSLVKFRYVAKTNFALENDTDFRM